jgi:HSP20 family molecular chaperone IbpA
MQANPTPEAPRRVRPPTDVHETADRLVLIADVPGASSDSIELVLEDDVLLLRARATRAAPAGWQPLGAEFELSDYERAFRLTTEIEREGIQAVLQNGLLRVVLPKKRPARGTIPVQG